CPSAKRVSKASDDLPEPETPVMTTNRLRGISRLMFLRLCSRAPRTEIVSMGPAILTNRGRDRSWSRQGANRAWMEGIPGPGRVGASRSPAVSKRVRHPWTNQGVEASPAGRQSRSPRVEAGGAGENPGSDGRRKERTALASGCPLLITLLPFGTTAYTRIHGSAREKTPCL